MLNLSFIFNHRYEFIISYTKSTLVLNYAKVFIQSDGHYTIKKNLSRTIFYFFILFYLSIAPHFGRNSEVLSQDLASLSS